jgi:hypothetical protein
VSGNGSERLHPRAGFELFAQGLGEIRHLIKVLRAFLVDPPKQLCSPKAFLAQALTKNGQTVEIKIKQVGRHVFAEALLWPATPIAS